MFDLLILLILNSFFCGGIYIATQFTGSEYFDENPEAFRKQPIKDKMILWWIRYYGSYLPEFFRYPLYYCMPCMASIWSVPFWAAYSKYIGLNLTEASLLWLMYAGALILVNYILKKVADL